MLHICGWVNLKVKYFVWTTVAEDKPVYSNRGIESIEYIIYCLWRDEMNPM